MESRIIWRIVDREAFFLDLSTGNYFSLNKVATQIWLLLHEGRSLEEIVSELVTQYGLAEDTAKDDLSGLIGELNSLKLADALGGPVTPTLSATATQPTVSGPDEPVPEYSKPVIRVYGQIEQVKPYGPTEV